MNFSIRTQPRVCSSTKAYTSACILLADTRASEPCGGDAGHGAFASFELCNEASMDWSVSIVEESGEGVSIDGPAKITLSLRGDCEQSVFLSALEQMVAVLRAAGVKPHDPEPPADAHLRKFLSPEMHT